MLDLTQTRGLASNEAGIVRHASSNTRAAMPVSVAGGGSLTSALDQKVAEKSDREAVSEAANVVVKVPSLSVSSETK